MDNALSGLGGQRAVQILPDVYGDGTVTHYLNRDAFTSPDPGTYSPLEPNAFEGPSQFQNDMAVSRTFRIAGNPLQFRWEVQRAEQGELQQSDLRPQQHQLRPDPDRRPAAQSCSSP